MKRLGPSTLVLWVALLAQPAIGAEASYAVAARTDLRTRSPLPGERGSIVTGDLEFVPDLQGALRWSTGLVSLQYNPSLLLREPQVLGPVTFLHRGRFLVTKRWERVSLTLVQEGAQGRLDVGALRNPEGSTPGGVPELQTLGTVPYVRSASLAVLDAQPSARVALTVSGGYLISGSPVAGNSMPLQWGPIASARLRLSASGRDTFSTELQASSARFATGQEQQIAQATETWERRLTTALTASMGAGVAVTREYIIEVPGGPIAGTFLEVLPVVLATAAWRQPGLVQPVQVTASARMAPFADRFTGQVYERIEARLQADWRPERAWTLTAAAGLAYAVPLGRARQAGDWLAFGEGAAAWSAKDWLLLGFSARVLWVEQPRLGVGGLLQWVGTLTLTVRDHDATAW
jgi:hypothetical protein